LREEDKGILIVLIRTDDERETSLTGEIAIATVVVEAVVAGEETAAAEAGATVTGEDPAVESTKSLAAK
jgi:hypothetical protein